MVFLSSAALLTPGENRAEWLREWRGELWHAREATRIDRKITWESEKAILRFCSGAIQDAFALRKLLGTQGAFRGSALECLLLLLAMLMASCLLYHVLPEVRAQNHPSLYQVNPNLIMIQDAFASSDSGAWRLPGNVDAWVLEPDEENRGVGYVIAHLTELGRSQMSANRIEIVSSSSDDSSEELCGISFANRTKGPWGFFQFALFLAFLALPAITSVSLGESQFCSYRPSWTNRVFRWMFLCAKIALLLPTVYFASLDLAYWHAPTYSVGAQYIQLISSFTMGLFGLRWILLDHRNRCPVCLRRVTHPARVGLTGRTFLAWNGTELICTGGHTLLHVPAMPTSWFSTQRWLYLDSSWKSLFVVSSSG